MSTGRLLVKFALSQGRVCRVTRTATYREAWEQSVGESGSLVVALANTLKAALGNLSYVSHTSVCFRTFSFHYMMVSLEWPIVNIIHLSPFCVGFLRA